MQLCLALMFQNDAHWLKLHLPVFAHEFDGIVALDGGSSDDGAEHLRSLGAVVCERPFEWDFAAQGNALIECVEALGYTHMMRLDPDEAIFPQSVILIRKKLARQSALMFPRHNFVRDRSQVDAKAYPDWQTRAWELHRGYRYERALHEVLNAPARESGVHIFHYGGITPWAQRWKQYVTYDRLQKGESLDADIGEPPTPDGYPPSHPFTDRQPLQVGLHAPFPERTTMDSAHMWYHRITLPDGTVTPGVQDSPAILRVLDQFGLPENMKGMRVLDVGAADGFYSFECERRGAKVTAIDKYPFETFQVAKKALGSKNRLKQADVYDLTPEADGQFDIILFLGIIYHLRYPLLALDRLRALLKTGGLLFVESHMIDECALLDTEKATTTPLVANVSGLWQVVDRIGASQDITFVPSVSGMNALLRKARFAPIGHTGTARGIFAAVAVPNDTGNFDLARFSYGGVDMLVRRGRYHVVDTGVIQEVQREYVHPDLNYADLRRVVDVGAHIGSWTRMVKAHAPSAEVVAVEPETTNFEMLTLNTAEQKGVTLLNGAVSYSDQPIYIGAHDQNSGGHVVFDEQHLSAARRDPHRTISAVENKYTIAGLLEAQSWERADVLKLDCENGEFDIFANEQPETLARFDWIVGEYHCDEAQFRRVHLPRVTGFFSLERLTPHPSDERGIFILKNKSLNQSE